jgi:hypothetical protein
LGLTHGLVPVLRTSAFISRDHQPRFHNRGYYLSARGAYAGFARISEVEPGSIRRSAIRGGSVCALARHLGMARIALLHYPQPRAAGARESGGVDAGGWLLGNGPHLTLTDLAAVGAGYLRHPLLLQGS